MGAPKQKWTSEEEAALHAGIIKHGVGKWRMILKDPEFSSILSLRSNMNLKDKFRNLDVIENGWPSRRSRKRSHDEIPLDTTVVVQRDEDIVDVEPLDTAPGFQQISDDSYDSISSNIRRVGDCLQFSSMMKPFMARKTPGDHEEHQAQACHAKTKYKLLSDLLQAPLLPLSQDQKDQSSQDMIYRAKDPGNECDTAVHVRKSDNPISRKTHSKRKPQQKKLANTRSSLRDISIEHFWEVIRPDIDNVHNVDSDGHCGFRAVAVGLGMDKKNGWLTVREGLIAELVRFKDEYMKILGDEGHVEQLLNSLDCTISPCPPENWFTLPKMGHLVASCYEVVFVCISKEGALTFVPLRSLPPTDEPKVIAIGNVERVHFVSLKLKPGCPIPKPMKIWRNCELAEGWGSLLKDRSDALTAKQGHQPSTQEGDEFYPIVVD
ncbi:Telomere repeat-binding factor [Thalictrum thalictroides]|uniref:Telomere repeat-binding factor n=1 Tax=Thalictrum thalictroides TaxID=46969 RepID=A0A7J6XBC5_THATH|nr:Telomere repeat-binding factor [Thalictrum thalictroides]